MRRPRVLLAGAGGREHALALALASSPSGPELIAAPGNPGIAEVAEQVEVAADDVPGIVRLARDRAVDLVVVGPEAPLVRGLADALEEAGIAVFGPKKGAAILEGSKTFAKDVMAEAGVPTARWGSFTDPEAAVRFARSLELPPVVKADGLAAGKGVVVAETGEEAEAAIRAMLSGAFGAASRTIVVEERLEGEELSVLALSDGEDVALLAPAQDHKRVGDGDLGPNTGGMGAYSPAPLGTPALLAEVKARCLLPVIRVLAARGTPLRGVLYAGLMVGPGGPRVLEYNVRFGDPEAQSILPRLAEDAYLLFLETARGRLAGHQVRFTERAAVTVVLAASGYPARPRSGDVIEGIEAARRIDGVVVHHAGTRRAPGGALVTAGGRVLAVTGLGQDLEAAARLAYQGVSVIDFEGKTYRRDIAHRAIGRAIGW